MRLSYSAISTYKTCPLQYKFRYIDKLPTKPSSALEFGNALHKSLHQLYSHNKPILELLADLNNRWQSEPLSVESDERYSYDTAKKILESYYEANVGPDGVPYNQPHVMEEWFEVRLDDHTLCGRIDRIDITDSGGHEIIDYKTNNKVPLRSKIDTDLQLSIYHWAAYEAMTDIHPEQLTLYFLRQNEKYSTTRDMKTIDNTKSEVKQVIRSIEHDVEASFQPRKNPLCGWCDYQQACADFAIDKPENENFISQSLFTYQNTNTKTNTITKTKSDTELNALTEEYFDLKGQVEDANKRLSELEKRISTLCRERGTMNINTSRGSLHIDDSGKMTAEES